MIVMSKSPPVNTSLTHFAGNSVGAIFIITPIYANIACSTSAERVA
jgi:hypothetical protein